MENASKLPPIARTLGKNVRTLRQERGLSLAELSERLGRIGRPIGLNVLSKIENVGRGVDVDDLVALAIALDVSPSRLLLPGEADDQIVTLTPKVVISSRNAWRWVSGEAPVPLDIWRSEAVSIDLDRLRRFEDENRPHYERDSLTLDEVEEHQDVLAPIASAASVARAKGLSTKAISGYLRLAETLETFAQQAKAKRTRKGK